MSHKKCPFCAATPEDMPLCKCNTPCPDCERKDKMLRELLEAELAYDESDKGKFPGAERHAAWERVKLARKAAAKEIQAIVK